MPANVETMTWFKEVPWHGLGTELKESQRFSISEGIKASGLDWNVELVPLFTEDGKAVAEHAQAVRRDKDGKILGVVGPRYTPLQNSSAFNWFQPLFDDKLCALHTAGSLQGGSKVWVLAEILGKEPLSVTKKDKVARFLLLSNSHDGTTSVRVSFTPIRVVCTNTLAMAHSKANSKFIRLRHSKDVLDNLEAVRDIINLANSEFEATVEQYRFLASKRVNESDLRKYVKIISGNENVKDEDISTRSQNIMNEMIRLMVHGRGNDSETRGTWWNALNGVNEYLNYNSGNSTETRLNNLWFGENSKKNLKAYELALEFAQSA